MRVAALGGCGAMGRATSWELAANDAVDELLVVDVDAGVLASFTAGLPGDIQTATVDAANHNALVEVLGGCDVVANALPYAFNLDVMDACLDVGAHYLDLGGLYHVTRAQLKRDAEFEDANLTAVLGIGASPGLTNVAVALGARRLDRVREIHIRTGAKGGSGFSYSVKTILDELTMNPIVFEGGAPIEVEPRSGRETYALPDPVGEVEGVFSIHSEVATLPESFENVEIVDFRVAFPPKLMTTCDVLVDLGLMSEEPIEFDGLAISPREFLSVHLARLPAPEPTLEWKSFRVDLIGEHHGDPIRVRCTTVVESRLHDWGLGATAVWTGVPLGVAAAVVGRGEALTTGAKPPERALDPVSFVGALVERDIRIHETIVD